MAVIYPYFLNHILKIHDNIQNQIPYPFFDKACILYEALRSVLVDGNDMQEILQDYGLTDYAYQKSFSAFMCYGVCGLIGIDSKLIIEELPVDVERMIFTLKKARSSIPATKMVTILKGFNHNLSLSIMRHLYASHGWALGTKPYKNIDFWSLNLKVMGFSKLRLKALNKRSFFHKKDKPQTLLEVFRTLENRGITKRYPGSRVSFEQHKKSFLSLGLLGLLDKARSPFRNSKLGFAEEGKIILSKIQKPEKDEAYFLKILESKKILVRPTCLTNVFTRWNVENFQSKFVGDLNRFLKLKDFDESYTLPVTSGPLPQVGPIRLDKGFIAFLQDLDQKAIPLANPGIFLFLPYLNRLNIFEKASTLMNLDPQQGYSWFSLLLLNLGRIFQGISSLSKACKIQELSLPVMAGLVSMPCNDSLLNGLASIGESELLKLRQHLTRTAKKHGLIQGRRIAFDFNMRDFTGDDVNLKNIGKGPSPKRKICFPGFRPHIAWDVDTGTPIAIEFRNGKARATTTIKRYVLELLQQALGNQGVEHIYLDSEYTAEHVWRFIVDSPDGLGADLTMCIKQNKRVKKFINAFLETNPTWLFFDEHHTYSEQTFEIPIRETSKKLRCVLKKKEDKGQLRCFGSTISGLDSKDILDEYRSRWTIENGIKDLINNYYLDNIPGIEPHRINVHYFVVTLARVLYEMFCLDYQDARNPDKTKKTLDTLRSEFLTGSNAVLSREKNELILRWNDHYPEKQHQALELLFSELNNVPNRPFPYLGGLKIRFEISEPRSNKLRNYFKRASVEFRE